MNGLTYAGYLQLDKLLSMQEPRTSDTAEREVVLAEHFFIVAHQASEIWLKQILADLLAATDALRPDYGNSDADLSVEYLDRVGRLLGLLHDQLVALEKMPLRHFAEFRPYLGTASGAQSQQFHQLDDLLGNDERPEGLYAAFEAYTVAQGMSIGSVCRLGSSAGVLHRVAEGLIDVGNGFWRWKIAHLTMISAMLGERPGTAGSSGAGYIASRIRLPFPQLRRLRGEVHEALVPTGTPN
ncbi:tryptophan 2,3-dioxygenase family protein [Kribbella sp. CA-293567]|uniref:tryptophan 2,3-dioxygenase family protein n=1 Tax=Kribbella sp. CA-293567 TaxID=3002436 RepID=UPI0022DE25BA|nr:tryptophan 2,3-dioxygenase family protein [Kribbella sp. CA-293567]WBQ07896.1 tryptophan 2,3-dioxygenase family protein [Kribbella sp. CA-293567]